MLEERSPPDFSPSLLLGVGLSFAPHSLLDHAVRKLTSHLNRLHPGLAERLSEANGKSFALVLADMPLNAVLHIENGQLSSRLTEKDAPPVADVTIHGTSEALLALLEGRSDGDALFFSRALEVEGDTEALLILRNALDNERIVLRDMICSLFGPLSGMASHLAVPMENLGRRFVRDINWLYHSAMAPLGRRQAQLAEQLQKLEARVEQAERALAKKQLRDIRNG